MLNPKIFAASAATFIVLLYVALFEFQNVAFHVNTLSEKLWTRSDPSPLEKIINEFEDIVQKLSYDFLDTWATYDADICPHKSDFFPSFMTWYHEWTEKYAKQWWEEALDGYLKNVLMNENPNVEKHWYHTMANKKFPVIRNHIGGNLDFAKQKLDSRNFVRPPIDTPSIDPRKVTIISGANHNSGKAVEMIKQSNEQRQEYAEYYGNKFRFYNFTHWQGDKSLEHLVWLKLPLLEYTFNMDPECEWIWCLDTDAILMNGDLNITRDILSPAAMEQIFLRDAPVFEEQDQFGHLMRTPSEFNPEDIDFIISQDMNGVNMGSFMIRRSKFTEELIQIWGEPLQIRNNRGEQTHERREQDAFTRLYTDFHYFRQRTAFVSSSVLNSYDFGASNRFISGDNLVHFAGRGKYEGFENEWNAMLNYRILPGGSLPEDYGWGTPDPRAE